MKHEEIYNTVRMICGSLLMVGMFMMPSCEDNRVEEEVSLEPSMLNWVNGDYINHMNLSFYILVVDKAAE